MDAKTEARAPGDRDAGGDALAKSKRIDPAIITPDTLRAALHYAERGLAVFPLRPGTKLPYPGSRGHLDATTDRRDLIDTWPSADSNVGLATGAPSGIWALDVDPRHGGDETLKAFLADNDLKSFDTVTTRTPSGGHHYWFRWPGDIDVPCSAGKVGLGLDVRGSGGYIVVPPSRVAEGGGYAFTYVPRLKGKPIIAGAPAALLARAVNRTGERKFAEPIGGTIGDGQRNAALASLAGSMRDRGCEADEIYALLAVANAKRCDPPLPDREVRGIVGSVMRYPPGRAWWASAEAEDEAADEWMARVQDEAAARWAGGR